MKNNDVNFYPEYRDIVNACKTIIYSSYSNPRMIEEIMGESEAKELKCKCQCFLDKWEVYRKDLFEKIFQEIEKFKKLKY
jgi:hypothetical protein